MNNKLQLYIRFGVHKDRNVMQLVNGYFEGVVIPAHIFAYTPEPTTAALSIIGKKYIIDPMSYIFKYNYHPYVSLQEDQGKKLFKPSIKKMAFQYGLIDHFEENDYRPLLTTDFDRSFVKAFVEHSSSFQLRYANEVKASSFARYENLLKQEGVDFEEMTSKKNFVPEYVVPPYFDFESVTDPWYETNLKLIETASSNRVGYEILPLICTSTEALKEKERIVKDLRKYNQIIIWVHDLDERNSKIEKLIIYKEFVQYAASQGLGVMNLYGSYFSVLLSKLGLGGVAHGIFYSEKKELHAAIGGIPVFRYYIEKLHEFFMVPQTVLTISDYPELRCNCSETCKDALSGDIGKLKSFENKHEFAQRHFLACRHSEIEKTDQTDLSELLSEIKETYEKYAEKLILMGKDLSYLKRWFDALSS